MYNKCITGITGIFLNWIKFVLFKQVNSCLKINVIYYQIRFLDYFTATSII